LPFDAVSALWQLLHVIRGIIFEATMMVCMNGSENVHKTPEIERRAKKAQEAEEFHSPIGQIKNTPEYIEKACHVCKSLSNPSVPLISSIDQGMHRFSHQY